MFYRVIKIFWRVLVELFFRAIIVRGHALVNNKPLLIVANHPNFVFDPVLLGVIYKRPIWFMAKATLFAGPVRRLLCRAFRMVPVYRKQDNPADMHKNTEMFEFAAECLRAGNAIALFPEGVSLGTRQLAPIKTGAARIAVQALEAGIPDLVIQPVGITYADLREFQTTVTLYVGKPIEVSAYRNNTADVQSTVKMLTAAIDEALRSVTVEVVDDSDRELVELIARLYSGRGFGGDDRALLTEIAEHVKAVTAQKPALQDELRIKLQWYVSLAEALGLNPSLSARSQKNIFLWFAAPFVMLGIIFHILPYRLTGIAVDKVSGDRVETATIKLLAGLAIFLCWYGLTGTIVALCSTGLLQIGSYILVLLVSGFFAIRYTHDLRLLFGGLLMPGAARAKTRLQALSDELFERCEALRHRD
jgi:glycerol-3-phosphate O-acyltransferase / dihydroxyacetone phosphate acyltransferase